MVIVGGGGHGLATAYYLATEYGITDVAVLERGPIGLGNVGRNTTIIRSNYFQPENIRFYEYSLKLWEGLERTLNFNAMVSQRGTLNLFHSEAQRDLFTRRANQMRLLGVDDEPLSRQQVKERVPLVDLDNGRYPVLGGFLQPRGGTVRHDAVAWGYARAASEAGVDIVEHCEVTGIRRDGARVTGVETSRGLHRRGNRVPGSRRALLAARRDGGPDAADREPRAAGVRDRGRSSRCSMSCITYGAGHFYVSQSDKGGPGVRRRHRRLQHLWTARHAADGRGGGRRGGDAAARARAPQGAAAVGRRHGHDHGRLADHLRDPAQRALSSTAAGATAASRRSRPAA